MLYAQKRRNDKMNSAHSFGARRYKTGCSGVSPEWHLFAILSFARERKYQENCEPTFARLFTAGARPHSANRSVSAKRRGSNREGVKNTQIRTYICAIIHRRRPSSQRKSIRFCETERFESFKTTKKEYTELRSVYSFLARHAGFEPATYRFVAGHSIH